MTRGACFALLALVSGCVSLRTSERAATLLREQLEATRFELSPEALVARLPTATPRCAAAPCTACVDVDLGTRAPEHTCFVATAEDSGARVQLLGTPSDFAIRWLWRNLDPVGLAKEAPLAQARAEAEVKADDARAAEAAEEAGPDPTFTPRFGPILNAFVSIANGPRLGFGARAGVRKWHLEHLLSNYLLEYEFGGEHRLSAVGRLEFASWGPFCQSLTGVPPWSLAPLVGLTWSSGPDHLFARMGVAVHANDVGGRWALPFNLELIAETPLPHPERVGVRFSFAFGL